MISLQSMKMLVYTNPSNLGYIKEEPIGGAQLVTQEGHSGKLEVYSGSFYRLKK